MREGRTPFSKLEGCWWFVKFKWPSSRVFDRMAGVLEYERTSKTENK